MKLFYVPRTRSIRPRWLLEEMGVPYELVRLTPADTKKPEHLKLHPLGHVPVLQDGDFTLYESSAIALYLGEKFPEKKMLPPPGTRERGLVYQWLFYGMTEIEPNCSRMMDERFKPEAERNAQVTEAAKARLHTAGGPPDQLLADGRAFIVGNEFSVADVVLGACLNWGNRMGGFEGYEHVQRYVKALMDRPAAKKASAD